MAWDETELRYGKLLLEMRHPVLKEYLERESAIRLQILKGLEGKKGAVLFPTLAAGVIGMINGFDRIEQDNHVLSVQRRYAAGDRVEWTYTTRQRLAEIDLLCDGVRDMKEAIRNVQSWMDVRDNAGRDMLYIPFDAERI